MILCYSTVLLLSCNALVVTLSLPLPFATVLRRPVITQLYLSEPSTFSQSYYAIKVGLADLSPLSVRAS